MTDTRTVTVQRTDGDVTITCPPWCDGQLHEAGEVQADIAHTSDNIELAVDTDYGTAVLLRLSLEARPFADPDLPPGREVSVSVQIDGQHYPHDVWALERLAEQLVEHATAVRAKARELAALEDGAAQ